jgi:hypothetical protein
LQFAAVKFDVDGRATMGAGQAAVERANYMLARSDWCDKGTATADASDDCVAPPANVTKAKVSAELTDYVELLKVLVRLQDTFNLGDPYNP